MKILHIVPTYVPAYRYGGPIKSVHYLNKWLVKKGIDVTVYTTNLNGDKLLNVPLNRETLINGVKVHYFPITWKSWEYSFALHQALAKNIKDFDLIHITSVFLSVSTLGAFYARKFHKPYIISPRGSLMKEPLGMKSNIKKKIYISLFEKRNLRNANVIHFTAESEKEEYIKAGFPLKKSMVISNGLDPDELAITKNKINFREKYGIGLDKKIVLSLGRINWKKGFDTLIPVFAGILKKEPNAVLVIVGEDDGYKKTVQSLIVNYQLQGKVIFTGILVDEEKIAVYKESNVFVLLSYSENFGMAVVEAMYFGLPIVMTKAVGIASDIIRCGAGIVINKNERSCIDAILKLLNNSIIAKKNSEQGKKLVANQFMMPKIVEKFIDTYKNLLIGN